MLGTELTCEKCKCTTDTRYKDPQSDRWLCLRCDRIFKANAYGEDAFKRRSNFETVLPFLMLLMGLMAR